MVVILLLGKKTYRLCFPTLQGSLRAGGTPCNRSLRRTSPAFAAIHFVSMPSLPDAVLATRLSS